jgi:hypothetical protein
MKNPPSWLPRLVALVTTDVLEERVASFIRVEKISEIRTKSAVAH